MASGVAVGSASPDSPCGLGSGVAVGFGVGVGLGIGVAVGSGVGVGVGSGVAVDSGVGVGVGAESVELPQATPATITIASATDIAHEFKVILIDPRVFSCRFFVHFQWLDGA